MNDWALLAYLLVLLAGLLGLALAAAALASLHRHDWTYLDPEADHDGTYRQWRACNTCNRRTRRVI